MEKMYIRRPVRQWMAIAIFLCIPLCAFGSPLVEFIAQDTALFTGDTGSWQIRVSNPDATALSGGRLVVTLPADYTVVNKGGATEVLGAPHTLEWLLSPALPPATGAVTKTFTAKPGCASAAGAQIQAQLFYGSGPSVQAALSSPVTILQLSPEFLPTGPASLSLGEQGTWQFRIYNKNTRALTASSTVVLSLPRGFKVNAASQPTFGPVIAQETASTPAMVSWTVPGYPAAGPSSYYTFEVKATPLCSAATGQMLSVYAQCPPVKASSTQLAIKKPAPSVSLSSGGSTQPLIHKGDTIVWDIVANNEGAGTLVSGLNVTEILGSGYSFISLTDALGAAVAYTGTWSAGATWNTGPITAGAAKAYKLTVTATGCSDWSNTITGNWSDGQTICDTLAASATANFVKNLPDVSITANFPPSLSYCGYPDNGNIATIRVHNAGPGAASNFRLQCTGMPADWGIKNIIVSTGGAASVSWDAAAQQFLIGSLTQASGARSTVEFSFTLGATGASCPPSPSAALVFTPDYEDECGAKGAPPVVGPILLSLDTTSLPRVSISLSGPRSAHANQTPLIYNLSAVYTAPLDPAAKTFNLIYQYPDGFIVLDAAGGTIDTAARSVTWANTVLTPATPLQKTIQMTAPPNCAAGNDTSFTASIAAITPALLCTGCTVPLNESAAQSTYIDEYLGPIASSSKSIQYFNSMTNALDASLPGGEVCTENSYQVDYTFRTGSLAPASWANITFTDTMVLGQSLVRIDDVRVNGSSYPVPAAMPLPNFTSQPLDLSYLDTAGPSGTPAPLPQSGASLSLVFTLLSSTVAGQAVDYARLVVPGFIPCTTKDYQETGNLVSFASSSATLLPASPSVIDAGEIKSFSITLRDNTSWTPLYDLALSLDTQGHYELVVDSSHPVQFDNVYTIDGTPVAAFAPVQNGTEYTWTFAADIRSHAGSTGVGAVPRISFYMRKNCIVADKSWNATLRYNSRCNNNAPPTLSATAASAPILVRKADLDIQLQPVIINAYNKYPSFALILWNKGSGTAFNANVMIYSGTIANYRSHTISSGAAPDSVTVTPDNKTVSFSYSSIPPGEKRYINIQDVLTGASDPQIVVTSTWGSGAFACQTKVDKTTIALLATQVLISEHSVDHDTDYCGHASRYTVRAKNTGLVTAYNPVVTETLPPGFSYVGNPVYSISSGTLTGPPSISFSGSPATGLNIAWDFSAVLPLDAAGDRPMPPGIEIGIGFDANLASCDAVLAYIAGNRTAQAQVRADPPYNALNGGSINLSSIAALPSYPAKPALTILQESRNLSTGGSFSTALMLANYGDTVEWRITLKSVGNFLASNVHLSTTLPANVSFSAASTTINGAADPWVPGTALALGDMSTATTDTSQTYIIIYRGTVNAATVDTAQQASVTWGCHSACAGASSLTEHSLAASDVVLRSRPAITLAVAMLPYPLTGAAGFTTDGGRLRITISNSGTKAQLQSGDYLSIQPPVGFNFNDAASYAPTISSSLSTHTGISGLPSLVQNAPTSGAGGRGELRWDNTRIDYIDPGETITITCSFEADGWYLDSTCAASGPYANPLPIPNSSIQASQSYHYPSGASTTQQGSALSPVLGINPAQAMLAVTVTPTAPIIEPGDTQKTFTITIRNNGDATAQKIAALAGAINAPFSCVLGPGFQNPAVTNNCGGTLAVSGNTITIANMPDLAAGQSKTIIVTLNIVQGRPAAEYWIEPRIRGTAMKDPATAVSAYSTGGPLPECSSYSDNALKINALEGKLIVRPDNEGSGKPGSQVLYLHTLKNNGQVGGDILLAATNSLGWNSLFYPANASGQITGGPITKINLGAQGAPNDSAYFALRLFIPANAAQNHVNITTIQATFASDPQVFRRAQDTTTVISSSLSIKKATRNLTASSAFSSVAEVNPGDTVEYRITFQNYGSTDIANMAISDPVPPFSDLLVQAYAEAGVDYTLKLVLYFADGTITMYINPPGPATVLSLDLNALCLLAPLASRFPDGVFRLRPGEQGELYYKVIIRN